MKILFVTAEELAYIKEITKVIISAYFYFDCDFFCLHCR